MAEDKILKKLLEHDKRFDKFDKRFDEHDKKFNDQNKRFDAIIKKLFEHDKKFVEVLDEMRFNQNENQKRFDEIFVIIQRLDQERVFTFEIVKRLQDDVDRIKKVLKLT